MTVYHACPELFVTTYEIKHMFHYIEGTLVGGFALDKPQRQPW